MPLRTLERWSDNGTTRRVIQSGETPFQLSPSRAARILGTTPETVKRAVNPHQSLSDAELFNLAKDIINGNILGWIEPGERSFGKDPKTGKVVFRYISTDRTRREMLLNVPFNNPPRA